MKSTKPKAKPTLSSSSGKPLGSHVVGFQLPLVPNYRIPLTDSQLLLICTNYCESYLCLISTQTPKPSLQFSLKYHAIDKYLLLPNLDLIAVGYGYIGYFKYKKDSYSVKLDKNLPIIDYDLRDNKYYKKVNGFERGNCKTVNLDTTHGKIISLSNNRIAVGGGDHIETVLIYNMDTFALIKKLEFNYQTKKFDEQFPGDCMYTEYWHDPKIYSINQLFQPKNKEVLFAFTCLGRLLVFDLEKYSLIKEENLTEKKKFDEICFNEKYNLLLARTDEKCLIINVMDGPNYSLVKTIDLIGDYKNYNFHPLNNRNQVMLYGETGFTFFNLRDLQFDSKNTVKKSDKKYIFFDFTGKNKDTVYIGTEKLNIYELNTETLEMKVLGKPRYAYTFAFENFLIYLEKNTIRFYVFNK